MGRSVHEHHVGLSREQEDELALGAVADEAGVTLESLRSNLERLERLCPPLVARRERGEVKPARLARLALDLDAVASRMMRLKLLLPNADVAEMCARKPALLEAGAVDRAEAVAAIVRTEYPKRFGDEDVFAEDDDSALQKTHHDDDSKTNESETKASSNDTNKKANALLASVPDILLEPSDECVREMVTRARALRFLLPTADVARVAGKKPSFVLTRDAGHASARGGHAAGLETGRSYKSSEGVPKQEKKNTKKTKSKSVDDESSSDSRDDSSVSESGGVSNDAEVRENENRDGSWFERWHVAISAREVRARMPQDCDVDRLLTDHPNILAMDVPALFEDLRAVFPTRDPADVLRANPKIAYQVRRRSATRDFFFRACVSFS